ncbi:MAG: DUF4178 domain-containing protein [Elusimicrobia bacterium]|nr:DUF4178 domain-containing protein [Elusimicrobiota bacterium]
MPKLEDLRVGDWVRWDSRDWEVTDRDNYRESSDYLETQWELQTGSGPAHYLVLSREKKAAGTEEVWVCTRRTAIGGVQLPAKSGGWRGFKGKDSMEAAPEKVRFDGLEFSLDGRTEGRAEDDEGDTVDKLTWDYYDPTRSRNLAIEVWKEPDADYYEAYDGRVLRPSDVTPLPPRPGRARRRAVPGEAGPAGYAVAAAFGCLFFVPLAGGMLTAFDIAAEYLLALLLPAFCVYMSLVTGAHRGLLLSSAAAALAGAALVLKVRGLGASYWEYAVYGLLAGPAIIEGASRLFGGIRSSDKPGSAGNATLLLLFIIGFAHYIKAAPRPHNSSGLLAACALPALPALLVYLVYYFKGVSDERA